MVASEVRVLPCTHRFCKGCIARLQSSGVNNLCPLCRASLPPSAASLFADAETLLVRVDKDKVTAATRLALLGEAKAKLTTAIDIDTEHAGARNRLGQILEGEGKYAEAKPLYEAALALWSAQAAAAAKDGARPDERKLRWARKKTATAMNNLGSLMSAMGKFADARKLFQRSFAIRVEVLGPDHRDTVMSRAWLADTLQKMGCHSAALPILRKVVADRRRIHGNDHPETAQALNNLAVLLEEVYQLYDESLRLKTESLKIRRAYYGEHHPDVATSLNNMASLLQNMGDLDEAERLYRQSLSIDTKALGTEVHPKVATGFNNLSQLLQDRGRYEEAMAMMEKARNNNHHCLYAAGVGVNKVC